MVENLSFQKKAKLEGKGSEEGLVTLNFCNFFGPFSYSLSMLSETTETFKNLFPNASLSNGSRNLKRNFQDIVPNSE